MCSYFLVFFGLISAYYFRKQFLISLLSLEFVLLGLFVCVLMHLGSVNMPVSLSLYVLVLGACEASLGLSLLVSMTRLSGSDILSLISIVKC